CYSFANPPRVNHVDPSQAPPSVPSERAPSRFVRDRAIAGYEIQRPEGLRSENGGIFTGWNVNSLSGFSDTHSPEGVRLRRWPGGERSATAGSASRCADHQRRSARHLRLWGPRSRAARSGRQQWRRLFEPARIRAPRRVDHRAVPGATRAKVDRWWIPQESA